MDISSYTTEDFLCDESFRKYCMGTEQAAILFWEGWIKNNPHKEEEVVEAKRLFTILNARQGNLSEQIGLLRDGMDRFELFKEAITSGTDLAGSKIGDLIPAKEEARFLPALKFRRVILPRLAAAAVILLMLAPAAWLLLSRRIKKQVVSAEAAASVLIRSGNEPRKTVVLPDGSVVTLHSNTTITLNGGFNSSGRELTLSGEAFFDIVHNEQFPFIVHTADINIEVLGTLFNVSAYPKDAYTETSLFRGKVAVSTSRHPERKIILTPSQKLITANSSGKSSVPDKDDAVKKLSLSVDPADHKAREIAWVRNRLKIVDEPLESIAGKLQAWYGIPIVFTSEEVKGYRYSGTFESETVVKALEALQLSYPFNFQVEHDSIIIGK